MPDQERIDARATRNFQRAEIRDELHARGIVLIDTAQGTEWQRSE